MSIKDIRGVGEYLSKRFVSESYWMGRRIGMRRLSEMIRFVGSRRGVRRKDRLREWLRRIMLNERGGECVGKIRRRGSRLCRYEAREINEKGWNGVVRYMRGREELRGMKDDLPRYLRRRRVTGYPLRCE